MHKPENRNKSFPYFLLRCVKPRLFSFVEWPDRLTGKSPCDSQSQSASLPPSTRLPHSPLCERSDFRERTTETRTKTVVPKNAHKNKPSERASERARAFLCSPLPWMKWLLWTPRGPFGSRWPVGGTEWYAEGRGSKRWWDSSASMLRQSLSILKQFGSAGK